MPRSVHGRPSQATIIFTLDWIMEGSPARLRAALSDTPRTTNPEVAWGRIAACAHDFLFAAVLTLDLSLSCEVAQLSFTYLVTSGSGFELLWKM